MNRSAKTQDCTQEADIEQTPTNATFRHDDNDGSRREQMMKISAIQQQPAYDRIAIHRHAAIGAYSPIPAFLLRLVSFLFVLVCGSVRIAQAATDPQYPDQASSTETTLAIFTEGPMPEGLWPALTSALHSELASVSPELRTLAPSAPRDGSGTAQFQAAHVQTAQFQIVRGDRIAPGFAVDNSITVYLLGVCETKPAPQPDLFGQRWASGALGWVNMSGGKIEPFIHVDCKRIGQMLGRQGMGRSRDQRNQFMANAIARVVAHEWIHIATQSSHHEKHGIGQAQFSVADLLAHAPKAFVNAERQAPSFDCDADAELERLSALTSLVPSRGTK